MKTCQACTKQIPDRDEFCGGCGSRFSDLPPVVSKPAVKPVVTPNDTESTPIGCLWAVLGLGALVGLCFLLFPPNIYHAANTADQNPSAIIQDPAPVALTETERQAALDRQLAENRGQTFSAPVNERSNSGLKDLVVTRSAFNSIQTGMSYAQVRQIIGSNGSQTSKSDIGGDTFEIYVWTNPDGSYLQVSFSNGKLDSKHHTGLQ
jgi:hypothetical protein